jgi:transposase InsO family protein
MTTVKPISLSAEALFRYRLVSSVNTLQLSGRKLEAAVRAVADELHTDVHGEPRRVSRRTLHRWFQAYRKNGLEGLEPQQREKSTGSAVLHDRFLEFLKLEREQDPVASIPEMIKRARLLGVLRPEERVCRTTVWRACQRLGIETRRRKLPPDNDSRRFAFAERMQMVLADFVYFRAGANQSRRVALYFLDDATRFGLGVAVGTRGEQTEIFLRTLHEVLCRFGLMDALYLDRGPAFSSDDTVRVLAQLDIGHVQGQGEYPEGHGKIERFNQSVKARLLRSLSGAPEVDPQPGSLVLRLRHDLLEVYNHLPHEGLSLCSPYQCWGESARPLRPAPSHPWLESRFTLTERRRVTNDHVISYEGTHYEVPRGHAGHRIRIYRRILEDNALYIRHQDRFVQLHPVDLYGNATSPRSKRIRPEEPPTSICKTSSTLAFEQTYGTVLDSDGGFTDPDEKED